MKFMIFFLRLIFFLVFIDFLFRLKVLRTGTTKKLDIFNKLDISEKPMKFGFGNLKLGSKVRKKTKFFCHF
jgi:hypothetical protein